MSYSSKVVSRIIRSAWSVTRSLEIQLNLCGLIIIIIIIIMNTAHVECKGKGDTSTNWSDWEHFQII